MKIISLEDKGIYDVSNAHGSQTYLIVGKERTAVVDCGMAYSAKGLIENIKRVLGDRPLDYILLTHSHYDHVSGIPALKKEWPGIEVFGGAYVKHVFESRKAKTLIRELNENAMRLYGGEDLPDFDVEKLEIDHVIGEGSRISLGDRQITAYETPGHTRCSMSFLMDEKYFFASETTGVIAHGGAYEANYLVSYKMSEESLRKCMELPMRYVLVPHSYIFDLEEKPDFWNFCKQEMIRSKDRILHMHEEGATVEEMVENTARLRDEVTKKEHPYEAFRINETSMIHAVLREFCQGEA